MDVNEELKFLRKFKKKIFFWGGECRGQVGGGGGQGGCERRLEVFVKIKNKIFIWGGGRGGSGQGGWSGWGVRIDVNKEVKFL